jgi:hypothetical protein
VKYNLPKLKVQSKFQDHQRVPFKSKYNVNGALKHSDIFLTIQVSHRRGPFRRAELQTATEIQPETD